MKNEVVNFFRGLFGSPYLSEFERETLKRIKKKDGNVQKHVERRPNKYVGISNRFFSDLSMNLIKRGMFKTLPKDLVKANLEFLPKSYVSTVIFTTLLSFLISIALFIFFLFFNVGVELPIITLSAESIPLRILKTFWMIFAIPVATFTFMYLYPSLEKDAVQRKIDQELPFATIHMSAIAGSLIDPTKIFTIIISTKEYEYLNKEFLKLMSSINIMGHDLVSALRLSAANTSSKELADLFNGLATTINSGGDLTKFFKERSESLLFEYNLEKEKNTKLAETFMDIYISVVIAAPMILMLLLMMMKISGIGIQLSTGAITLIMISAVSFINVAFLTFLHIKQPNV